MKTLCEKHCSSCKVGAPTISNEKIEEYLSNLDLGWELIEEHKIHRDYRFRNFEDALEFVDNVGQIAEDEGHHPDIFLTWGKAGITLWTHKANGLTENDFIMAAKIDRIYQPSEG